MADDRHYVPGDFYRIDDRTGFKVRSGRTRMEWTGFIVSTKVWEERQPQDFVRGVKDNQNVPNPRPRQPNVFIEPNATSNMFEVYGDNPIAKKFLVCNQNSGAYNPGINEESAYTNPAGLAQIAIYGGTLPPVLASNFGSNIT